jgi:hypothetical protein
MIGPGEAFGPFLGDWHPGLRTPIRRRRTHRRPRLRLITWDTTTTDVNTTGVTGRTIAHSIGSGLNRCVWMIIWGGGSGLTVSGTPTFGGTNVTALTGSPLNGTPVFTDLYVYRLVNPTSGSNNFVINFTGSVQATIAIISRDEVNQTTPDDGLDTDTTFEDAGDTTAITTSETGDRVVDIVATGFVPAGGFIEGAGQTELANLYNSGEGHALALSYKDGGASVTQTWDIVGAIGDIASGYHVQFNINTDGAAPPPPVLWNHRPRAMRPAPWTPGNPR